MIGYLVFWCSSNIYNIRPFNYSFTLFTFANCCIPVFVSVCSVFSFSCLTNTLATTAKASRTT